MTIKELRNFIYENYYKWVGFNKENTKYSFKCHKNDLQPFAIKLTKKYLILIILKNIINHICWERTKIGEMIKVITWKPKLIENSNIFDLKSVTIEHPKTIRQDEKVGSGKYCTNLLCSETTKHNFFWWKKVKK